jgi:DNA-binding NtrC family response regulator
MSGSSRRPTETAAAIQRETFREDLYYRLREVVLRVPPLREQPEDLPLLVEHCRRRFNARDRLAIDGVTRAAVGALEGHSWPGNVRELEAVVREAMVLKGTGAARGGGSLARPDTGGAGELAGIRVPRTSTLRPATRSP